MRQKCVLHFCCQQLVHTELADLFLIFFYRIRFFAVFLYPLVCQFRDLGRIDLIQHNMKIRDHAGHIRIKAVVLRELNLNVKFVPCIMTDNLFLKSFIVVRRSDH